jgi:hypothetical protein
MSGLLYDYPGYLYPYAVSLSLYFDFVLYGGSMYIVYDL